MEEGEGEEERGAGGVGDAPDQLIDHHALTLTRYLHFEKKKDRSPAQQKSHSRAKGEEAGERAKTNFFSLQAAFFHSLAGNTSLDRRFGSTRRPI